MRLEIHVTVTHSESLMTAIARLQKSLNLLHERITEMTHTLEELLAAVEAENSQVDSLITLLSGIKAQLDAVTAGALTPSQQASVDQIFDHVAIESAAVVKAMAANTPAAGG